MSIATNAIPQELAELDSEKASLIASISASYPIGLQLEAGVPISTSAHISGTISLYDAWSCRPTAPFIGAYVTLIPSVRKSSTTLFLKYGGSLQPGDTARFFFRSSGGYKIPIAAKTTLRLDFGLLFAMNTPDYGESKPVASWALTNRDRLILMFGIALENRF